MSSDTIFALSSGALPAAIAIVRVSGPAAEDAAKALAGPLPEPRRGSLRTLRAADRSHIDEALVLHFPGPNTATGEALVEFHCHGGRAVVARLLAELTTLPGLREAEPGEFTRRALLNGRLDLPQAEGLADLLGAETEWQRRAAVESAGGALSRHVERWRERLVILSARCEAAIDYVGDEDETGIDLDDVRAEARSLVEEWTQWLDQPRAELLADGLKIVLAGPPNSGKSSLFNALIGSEKAIVTAIPGTTRDILEAKIDMGGIPLRLFDTAGLRISNDEVERIGIERAREARRAADLVLWLGEPADAPATDLVLKVHSRADERPSVPAGSIATSVRTQDGLAALKTELSHRAHELLPPPDRAAMNRRQAGALSRARQSLTALQDSRDIVIFAESVRHSLAELDALTGRASIEDVLDALFGRFCLGK